MTTNKFIKIEFEDSELSFERNLKKGLTDKKQYDILSKLSETTMNEEYGP